MVDGLAAGKTDGGNGPPHVRAGGPETGFRRVLTLGDLILFGIAFVGPTAPYSMFGIASVRSRGHLALSYLLAMLAMSATASSYGRMAAAYPEAGSTYAYASRTLHPVLGFFAGWVMILDYVLIPILSVIFVGLTAERIAPGIPFAVWAVLVAAGMTAINTRGIEMTSRATRIMNALMGLSLAWFIVVTIRALLRGTGAGTLVSSKPFFNPATFSFGRVMDTTSLAVLSFIGFDGVTTLAEDARNPERDVGRATVLVCFMAGGVFVLQSYLAQLAWPDYTRFPRVETAFMDVGRLVGGAPLFYFLSFILVVGGVASAMAGQASASRLLCGMGRDGVLPKRVFGYVNPATGTPVYNILLMGIVHICGAILLNYAEAAELVNFGAFLGFIAVNLSVLWHYAVRLRCWKGAQLLSNIVLPGLGTVTCIYIWLHLSRLAFVLGAAWMVLGLTYLVLWTGGFRKKVTEWNL